MYIEAFSFNQSSYRHICFVKSTSLTIEFSVLRREIYITHHSLLVRVLITEGKHGDVHAFFPFDIVARTHRGT